MTLTDYDVIVINTSAGKDSQAMMEYVVGLAKAAGILHRVVAVHCDLGRVEWKGTKELAIDHCAHYGIHLHIVRREKGDLLVQVEERGMWPDNKNRYCTSDQKRDQVAKLVTSLVNDFIGANTETDRPVRVLNCMGLRAEESSARAKKNPFQTNKRLTNGKREVYDWLPIHDWTVGQVWDCIKKSGVKYHYAYDLGMPRLSCCFCIFASEGALMIAGKQNPELLNEYVRVEKATGHDFRHHFKIASIQERLANGEQPPTRVASWTM
jgi:3'-phosphoadenosine 5'-phosphosulfate sulfotransferase (PAPS reductase)/FAD synthetase